MKTDPPREAALFQAAVQLTGSARASFLESACNGDASLRRRLDALLAAHEQTEGALGTVADRRDEFHESPTEGQGLTEIGPLMDEAIGQKIGRYKILEKVGEGGCGVVYVAEQTEPVRRRVALKVIKLGMDTKQVVARFEAERQALAMMDHPNIAKVLDAGTTEGPERRSPARPGGTPVSPGGAERELGAPVPAGRPFFVMELIKGIPLTKYCDQEKTSTRERLDLFIKVCHAIQHAHQKGIIHRDIKPSNILVTLHDGVPVPKVIDFGIAKATEGRLTDATVYTQLNQFIGTPAYMSPEQAEMSGLDIDTRSDIYSLGVLLYELLTGKTPFDGKELMSMGLDAMRKTIREKEPLRPSTKLSQTLVAADVRRLQAPSADTPGSEEEVRASSRRLLQTKETIALLRGDLDWIVMKCLEKDRTRRYDTANGLAMDLKRHLNNETVVARPPSGLYRFQKTVRRNRLAFTAAGAVVCALVLGVIATTWQSVRAMHAKQVAVAARGQAEDLVSFMIQDLQPALKDYGRLSLLRQVDEKTVAYYAALPLNLRDPKTELAQADAIASLADILAAANDWKAAREKEREARALYQRLAERHPEIPEAAAGALRLGWTLYSADPAHSSADLDAFQQDNLGRWRELNAKFPANGAVRRGLGAALWDRTEFAAQRFNKPQEAIKAGLELQDHLRQLMTEHPESKQLPRGYANALGVLSAAYEAVGERDKAVQVSEEAETFYDGAIKVDPGNLSLLADAADAARNLSYRVASASLKRSRDAELVARERYRLLTTLDTSNSEWRRNFAMTHMMECYYLEGNGQIEAARQAFKKFDALLQVAQFRPEDGDKLMDNCIQLALLAAWVGDIMDARAQLAIGRSRFQAHYEKLPPAPADRRLAQIRWWNYQESQVLATMGDWPELEQVARQALSSADNGVKQQPGDNELLFQQALARASLGAALLNQDRTIGAVPLLEQGLAGIQGARPVWSFTENRDWLVCGVTVTLADALARTGERSRAKKLMETALATVESVIATQPENWEAQDLLAKCLVKLAGLLDITHSDEAARRHALLDRASVILNGSQSAGRMTADDKVTQAKIASLKKEQTARANTDSARP